MIMNGDSLDHHFDWLFMLIILKAYWHIAMIEGYDRFYLKLNGKINLSMWPML